MSRIEKSPRTLDWSKSRDSDETRVNKVRPHLPLGQRDLRRSLLPWATGVVVSTWQTGTRLLSLLVSSSYPFSS